MNVVFVVPHAEDEVLMGGASISKHKRNKDTVTVCCLEKPRTHRTKQQNKAFKEAAAVLSVDRICCLDLTEDIICNKLDILSKQLEQFLSSVTADILYTVSPCDNHQDHRALIKAINIATRIIGPNPVPDIRCGETISSTDQTFKTISVFAPTIYNVVIEADIQNKINALKCYKTEFRHSPHPRSEEVIRAYAQVRGSECMNKYAEAFMQLRKIYF